MARGVPFVAAQSVTLDGSGGGQVEVGAPGAVDVVVKSQSLSTSTAVKVPTAMIYRNFVSQANFIEGSYTGSNDSSDTRVVLQPTERLVCVWTGGDVGAVATYRIQGVQYPPGDAPLE